MKRKTWQVKELEEKAFSLSKKYNLSPYLIQLLLNRNIKEEDFFSFLNPSLNNLSSPFLLPDMERAVERINCAIKNKERIMVVGDYDVDGITSLVIFYEFIKNYDNFFFYIPDRIKEGYGLNQKVIQLAKDEKVKLIITFDCGTGAWKEIKNALNLGIEIIIFDHHLPKVFCPFSNLIFVNPKKNKKLNKFSELSSAGISFKLVQALLNQSCWELLDLVSLSIVCDLVPLVGDNRIFLKEGLKYLRGSKRLALNLICEVAKIKQNKLDTYHLGFILGPRLNASGRISHAFDTLNLFLTSNKEEAFILAKRLDEYNRQRKDIEENILKLAEEKIESFFQEEYVLVIEGEAWHPGVLGIVASRLVEKYYRPSFVISFEGEIGKGSGRSISNLDITEALSYCQEHLYNYGGHRKAAGIQISRQNLFPFKEKINQVVKELLKPIDLIPTLNIDFVLKFNQITSELVEEIEKLKPFGEANQEPLFLTYNVKKKTHPRKINNFYSLWLTGENLTYHAYIYDKDLLEVINYADDFDIVYSLEKDNYHNSFSLILKDIRLTN